MKKEISKTKISQAVVSTLMLLTLSEMSYGFSTHSHSFVCDSNDSITTGSVGNGNYQVRVVDSGWDLENDGLPRMTLDPDAVATYPWLWRSIWSVTNKFRENPSAFYWRNPLGGARGANLYRLNNNISEIWLDNSLPLDGMRATWQYACDGFFKEVDIMVNGQSDWALDEHLSSKLGLRPYGGARRIFESSMLHELGHAAGLGHSAGSMVSIMGEDDTVITTNGDSVRPHLGADTSLGLSTIYGTWDGAPPELSISHWTVTGTLQGGEYSDHSIEGIYSDAGGRRLFGTADNGANGMLEYKVFSDDMMYVPFTVENSGNADVRTAYDLVVSENNIIGDSDDVLISSSNYIDVAAGEARSWKVPVQLPGSSFLQSGEEYFVGIIIDSNNDYPNEASESNNSAYQIIRIR